MTPHSEKRRGRRLIWFGVFLVVATAGIVVITQRGRGPVASVEMTDGRILQIEAISFGTNHQVGSKAPLVESFGPWLPRGVRRFLSPKYPHSEINVTEPELVVWVNTLDAKTGKHVDCQRLRIEFVDQHGDLFGAEDRSWFGHEKFWRDAHRFPAFPRTEPKLTLQITPLKKGKHQASRVQVPNPCIRVPERWNGGGLPQAKQFGEIEVVLADLAASSRGGTNKTWETPSRYWEPLWEFRQQGKIVSGWEKPEWIAKDPTGNRGKYLGIHAPVLRYTVTFYPTVTNVEATTLVGSLPSVAVTAIQANVWWHQKFQFGTNEVIALGFLPPGTHIFSEGTYQTNPPVSMGPVGGGAPSGWVGQSKQINPLQKKQWHGHYTPVPTLYLRAESLPDKQRWAVRLRDDQGRLWPTEPEPQGRRDFVRPFLAKLPPEVTTVIPEIVVLKPLKAEFTVQTATEKPKEK